MGGRPMLKLARFVRRGPVFATAAVTVLAVSLAIPGAAAGAVKAPDTMLPVTVSTFLFGGGPPSTAISVPAGTAVTDAAELIGTNTAAASGTVTYQVYSDSSCTVPVSNTTSTVTFTGGAVRGSDAVTLTTAGTYYWQATYSGDTNNLPAASTCGIGGEVETVTAAATTLTTTLSAGSQSGTSISVPVGTGVIDTATLTGANAATATGTVTYNVYSDPACLSQISTTSPLTITTAGTLPGSGPVTFPTVGTYYWQAVYSGDANNAMATTTCGVGGEVETVTPPATTLTTSLTGGSQSGPSISVPAGTAVADAATLTGTDAATATGTITYDVYSDSGCTTPVSDTSSTVAVTAGAVPASNPVTFNTAGTYYWQASYSGDANNLASVSACNTEVVTVTAASTSVTTMLSEDSVTAGVAVTDTATLSGAVADAATGTVTYQVYSDSDCTMPVSDTSSTVTITGVHTVPASDPVTIDIAGTYYWQASYSGDANNLSSTTCGEVEVVNPADTTTTTMLSASSVAAGVAVTDTATLTGAVADAATGTVTYQVYSDSDCTMPVSDATSTENVTAGTVPASDPVALTAAGTYYWQASYSGDANNLSSTSTCGAEVETVTPADTGTATSLSGGGQSGLSISVPAGTAVTDTATLSGTDAGAATGTVTYDVYSDSGCTTLVSTGTPLTITTPGTVPASDPVTLATAGTYYWQATYSGDPSNNASVSTCGAAGEVETVTPAAPPSTTLRTQLSGTEDGGWGWGWGFGLGDVITVSPGTAVTDSATLSGANTAQATGTVTYTVYSLAFSDRFPYWQSQWEPVASGGTVTVTAGSVPDSDAVTLPPGIYYWQASYSGDGYNAPSVSQLGSEVEYVIYAPGYRFGSRFG
jgi:hypothetical protein